MPREPESGVASPARAVLHEAIGDLGNGRFAVVLEEGGGKLVEALRPRWERIQAYNTEAGAHKSLLAEAADKSHQLEAFLQDIPKLSQAAEAPEVIFFPITTITAQTETGIFEAWAGLRKGGKLVLAGHNREGIKPAVRKATSLFGEGRLLANRASCRVVSFTKSQDATDVDPDGGALRKSAGAYYSRVDLHATMPDGKLLPYQTKPGVFSVKGTDAGTQALLSCLPPLDGKLVLDLGCGAGVLSLAVLRLGARLVSAVDANAVAVEVCRENLAGAPADIACTRFEDFDTEPHDVVVSNAPFHRGRKTDYGLARRVCEHAHRMLLPGGEFFLVAHHFLHYPRAAEGLFSQVTPPSRHGSYDVYHFRKPAEKSPTPD